MARADPNNPTANKIADAKPVLVGPYFSTYFPPKEAEVPKNKIAMENTNVVANSDQPVSAMIGKTNVEYA